MSSWMWTEQRPWFGRGEGGLQDQRQDGTVRFPPWEGGSPMRGRKGRWETWAERRASDGGQTRG